MDDRAHDDAAAGADEEELLDRSAGPLPVCLVWSTIWACITHPWTLRYEYQECYNINLCEDDCDFQVAKYTLKPVVYRISPAALHGEEAHRRGAFYGTQRNNLS